MDILPRPTPPASFNALLTWDSSVRYLELYIVHSSLATYVVNIYSGASHNQEPLDQASYSLWALAIPQSVFLMTSFIGTDLVVTGVRLDMILFSALRIPVFRRLPATSLVPAAASGQCNALMPRRRPEAASNMEDATIHTRRPRLGLRSPSFEAYREPGPGWLAT